MATELLRKQPFDSRIYTMRFGALLDEAETIATVVSVAGVRQGTAPDPETPLVVSEISTDGKNVLFRLAGGDDGFTYKVKVRVTTTDGNSLEGDGNLLVEDANG